MVDAAGQHEPVRVTYRKGFDGLPVFPPNGKTMVWTSNGGGTQSQLFEAKWNDAAARKLLNLPAAGEKKAATASKQSKTRIDTCCRYIGRWTSRCRSAGCQHPSDLAADVGRHIDYLCRPELGGRLTGTEGERKALPMSRRTLTAWALQPAGENGTFFQEFEFVSSVKLGDKNKFQQGDDAYTVDKDWRPLFFSEDGHVDASDVVFAGYGIVAPKSDSQPEYDSYTQLDVRINGFWHSIFAARCNSGAPPAFVGLQRATLQSHGGARARCQRPDPDQRTNQRCASATDPLSMDGTMGKTSLAVLSASDKLGEKWLASAGKELAALQKEFDKGEPMTGFALEGVSTQLRYRYRTSDQSRSQCLGTLACDRTWQIACERPALSTA